jgi:hypothetical protein
MQPARGTQSGSSGLPVWMRYLVRRAPRVELRWAQWPAESGRSEDRRHRGCRRCILGQAKEVCRDFGRAQAMPCNRRDRHNRRARRFPRRYPDNRSPKIQDRSRWRSHRCHNRRTARTPAQHIHTRRCHAATTRSHRARHANQPCGRRGDLSTRSGIAKQAGVAQTAGGRQRVHGAADAARWQMLDVAEIPPAVPRNRMTNVEASSRK